MAELLKLGKTKGVTMTVDGDSLHFAFGPERGSVRLDGLAADPAVRPALDGSRVIAPTSEVEVFNAGLGPTSIVYAKIQDSTRGARDWVRRFGSDDVLDLRALDIDGLAFSNADLRPGILLVRTFNSDTGSATTVLTLGGWSADAFEVALGDGMQATLDCLLI